MALSAASQASSGSMPRLINLLCTSARLTVLALAVRRSCGVSLSAPGSRLSRASSAEASSTILLTLGGLAPFGNELVHQRSTRLHVPPDQLLGAFDATLQSGDSQLIVFNPQDNFIARIDAQRLAKGGGDYYPTVFIDASAGFLIHVTCSKI